jgi:hypothetical protein
VADGGPNYWGIDPCRFSALAFTPLLAGLTEPEYETGLQRELQHYAGPPWTLWASWSYVVLEAAPRTGDRAFAGRVAAEIVGRVYDELDAREPGGPNHPTPGVAREYWPLELDTWASCEGYGWGANTASLLVRQIFGFIEGPYTDAPSDQGASSAAETAIGQSALSSAAQAAGWHAPSLVFELRPALPEHFLVPGREYWLTNLPYRGGRLAIGYWVAGNAAPDGSGARPITILVAADAPTVCQLADADHQQPIQRSDVARDRHELHAVNGGSYRVELWPG